MENVNNVYNMSNVAGDRQHLVIIKYHLETINLCCDVIDVVMSLML